MKEFDDTARGTYTAVRGVQEAAGLSHSATGASATSCKEVSKSPLKFNLKNGYDSQPWGQETRATIENEYGPMEYELGDPARAYSKWAANMAVGLKTGVPWIMCKQDDVPDPTSFDHGTRKVLIPRK